MKYLKKFENRLTNVFKSKDVDMWDEYIETELETEYGYNKLIGAVHAGNLKRFEYLLPIYKNKINNIYDGKNVLIEVIIRDIDLYEKKKMIELLLDNGVNYKLEFGGDTFYDLITNDKLKKWFDDKYPDIVKELNLYKNTNKYNL